MFAIFLSFHVLGNCLVACLFDVPAAAVAQLVSIAYFALMRLNPAVPGSWTTFIHKQIHRIANEVKEFLAKLQVLLI